tara:strand:- start:2946 stop:3761 length:816 start_codon:yes stop_codon:yes gene_type:complete
MVRIDKFQGGDPFANATRSEGKPEYLWYAVSCDKPAFNIEVSEHRLNNRIYKFPKGVTWEDITIVMVDTDCPSLAELLGRYLEDAGGPGLTSEAGRSSLSNRRFNAEATGLEDGQFVVRQGDINTTVTKVSAVSALGLTNIYQLDMDGRILEKWTLHGAFIKSVNWGKLDYNDDQFMNVTMTLTYDWATVGVGSRDIDNASPLNHRMHFWSGENVEAVNASNADLPSIHHLPNGRGYYATDENNDGRPDILENYLDGFIEQAVVEQESNES